MNGAPGMALKVVTLAFALFLLAGFVWYRQSEVRPIPKNRPAVMSKAEATAPRDESLVPRDSFLLPEGESTSEEGVPIPIIVSSKSVVLPVFNTRVSPGATLPPGRDPFLLPEGESIPEEKKPIAILPGTKSIVMPVFQTKGAASGKISEGGDVEVQTGQTDTNSIDVLMEKATNGVRQNNLISTLDEPDALSDSTAPVPWPKSSLFGTSKSGIVVSPSDLEPNQGGILVYPNDPKKPVIFGGSTKGGPILLPLRQSAGSATGGEREPASAQDPESEEAAATPGP